MARTGPHPGGDGGGDSSTLPSNFGPVQPKILSLAAHIDPPGVPAQPNRKRFQSTRPAPAFKASPNTVPGQPLGNCMTTETDSYADWFCCMLIWNSHLRGKLDRPAAMFRLRQFTTIVSCQRAGFESPQSSLITDCLVPSDVSEIVETEESLSELLQMDASCPGLAVTCTWAPATPECGSHCCLYWCSPWCCH